MSEPTNDDLRVYYHDEVQLLDYGESRTRGKYVLFRLSETEGDPLVAFRGLDVGTKIKAGHIFNLTLTAGAIVASEGDEDQMDIEEQIAAENGEPSPILKGGPLSRQAAMMIQHENFQSWLRDLDVLRHDDLDEQLAGLANEYVAMQCGIESKRELDHNDIAASKFRALCREYHQWTQAHLPQGYGQEQEL